MIIKGKVYTKDDHQYIADIYIDVTRKEDDVIFNIDGEEQIEYVDNIAQDCHDSLFDNPSEILLVERPNDNIYVDARELMEIL